MLSLFQSQEKKDSLYHKIEEFSNKRKAAKFLYRFVFRRTPDSVSIPTKNAFEVKQNFDGKTIRNIKIVTIDPFGNASDEVIENEKWYEKAGRRLHRNTKNSVVHNFLLFKEGETYNAQKIYESERLLREQEFINRATIIASENGDNSVDLEVRILDSWSLKPRGSFSGSRFGVGITEENVLGTGDTFEFIYRNNFKEKKNNFLTRYLATNLFGSYINAEILGEKDYDKNQRISFRADREFFSPLTRWAGGISLEYFKRNEPVIENFGQEKFYSEFVKVFQQDFWGGYQIPVFVNDEQKISSNLVFSARFKNFGVLDAPSKELDPHDYFQSYNIFLGSVGYNQRKFSVQTNVFRYDLPEDIPYGKFLYFSGGFLRQAQLTYPYAAVSTGFSTFFKPGFFSFKMQYGSFLRKAENFRSNFTFDATYFTPLTDWKFGKVRHFVSPSLILSNQNFPSYEDRINLSSNADFPTYDYNFIGKNKLILRYQMQIYLKKTWKNFHFAPYFTAGTGWLSDDKNLFKAKTNLKAGIGVLIYNPFLVFNRFQISFMYYPQVPFDYKNDFDFNQYRNHHFPIHSFEMQKPEIVGMNSVQ